MDISLGLALSLEGGGALSPPTIAPVLMVTTELGSDVAALSWTASDKATSSGFYYDVEVDIDGGGYGSLTTTTSLTYNDTQGTAVGETYTYRITPHNDYGGGPSSNTVGVVLPGESEAPILSGPSYVESGTPIAALTWTAIPGATFYSVQSSANGTSYSEIATPATNAYNATLSADTYFRVIPFAGSFEGQTSNPVFIYIIYPPPTTYTYLRPNGIDGYRRPGGTDLYIRP
jgi:hypothetical protein